MVSHLRKTILVQRKYFFLISCQHYLFGALNNLAQREKISNYDTDMSYNYSGEIIKDKIILIL